MGLRPNQSPRDLRRRDGRRTLVESIVDLDPFVMWLAGATSLFGSVTGLAGHDVLAGLIFAGGGSLAAIAHRASRRVVRSGASEEIEEKYADPQDVEDGCAHTDAEAVPVEVDGDGDGTHDETVAWLCSVCGGKVSTLAAARRNGATAENMKGASEQTLRTALADVTGQIKAMVNSWKDETGRGQFVVSEQQHAAYMAAVAMAGEIKDHLALLDSEKRNAEVERAPVSTYASIPPLDAEKDDLWYDTDDNRMYQFDGISGWLAVSDPPVRHAEIRTSYTPASAGGITTYGHRTSTTFEPPPDPRVGDTWIDTGRGGIRRRWDGSAWRAQSILDR